MRASRWSGEGPPGSDGAGCRPGGFAGRLRAGGSHASSIDVQGGTLGRPVWLYARSNAGESFSIQTSVSVLLPESWKGAEGFSLPDNFTLTANTTLPLPIWASLIGL